ncbi:putative integrase [Orientia tsutsugamushi str. Gilliam]|uniref:Putative integrase n=1 Tax=Orientia tsutsugamushi str. Gilliam TaxID=1359184 RepID=A0A0F3M9E8_ORITS|nr:putative integrase [Orientia tsutsugamushi str. Gilliam]
MSDAGASQRISTALNHRNPDSTIPYTISCMELVRQYMSKATKKLGMC